MKQITLQLIEQPIKKCNEHLKARDSSKKPHASDESLIRRFFVAGERHREAESRLIVWGPPGGVSFRERDERDLKASPVANTSRSMLPCGTRCPRTIRPRKTEIHVLARWGSACRSGALGGSASSSIPTMGPAPTKGAPPALRRIRSNLPEAALVMGADPPRVWREIDRPSLGRALLIGGAFALAILLGEFGGHGDDRPRRDAHPALRHLPLSQPARLAQLRISHGAEHQVDARRRPVAHPDQPRPSPSAESTAAPRALVTPQGTARCPPHPHPSTGRAAPSL